MEQVPEETPSASRQIRPEAVPDEVRMVVENWQQIQRQLGPVSREMLSDVLLSVSDSGALVLAFSQETRAEYFRREENKEEIIQAASKLIDRSVTLDVRHIADSREFHTMPELREVLKNVTVEMLD